MRVFTQPEAEADFQGPAALRPMVVRTGHSPTQPCGEIAQFSSSQASPPHRYRPCHSITLLARSRIDWGKVIPIAFAVFRFTTKPNVVGRWMGSSAGFAPLRILST